MKKIIITVFATIIGLMLLGGGIAYYFIHKEQKIGATYDAVYSQVRSHIDAQEYEKAEQVFLAAIENPVLDAPILQFELHSKLGFLYQDLMKDTQKAKSQFMSALSIQLDDRMDSSPRIADNKIDLLRELGSLERNSSNYEEAKNYFSRALAIAEKFNDSTMITLISLDLGSTYIYLKDFDRAETFQQRARDAIESMKPVNLYAKASVYNDMAFMYYKSTRYEKAASMIETAIEIAKLMNDGELKSNIYDTAATIYEAQRKYDLAMEYAEKLMEYKNISPYALAVAYATHARISAHFEKKQEACNSYTESTRLYRQIFNQQRYNENRQQMEKMGCEQRNSFPDMNSEHTNGGH